MVLCGNDGCRKVMLRLSHRRAWNLVCTLRVFKRCRSVDLCFGERERRFVVMVQRIRIVFVLVLSIALNISWIHDRMLRFILGLVLRLKRRRLLRA